MLLHYEEEAILNSPTSQVLIPGDVHVRASSDYWRLTKDNSHLAQESQSVPHLKFEADFRVRPSVPNQVSVIKARSVFSSMMKLWMTEMLFHTNLVFNNSRLQRN